MALESTHTTSSDVILSPAYVRIEGIQLSKEYVSFAVCYYASSTSKIAVDRQINGCAYDLEGENPIKQVYLHLKTLPEFSDAVDC